MDVISNCRLTGNWPKSRSRYNRLFTDLNVDALQPPTDPENAATSAAMYETWPSTYSVAPAPFFFKDVVVIEIQGGEQYTAQNYRELFRDAGMPLARELADYYVGFVDFRTPGSFPTWTSTPRSKPASRPWRA